MHARNEKMCEDHKSPKSTARTESAGSSPRANIAAAQAALTRDSVSPTTDENEELWDADSALDDSFYDSETTSLAEEVMKYREENGRTYHSFGSTEHWGPNDEDAREQQDLSHHFFTLVLEDQFFTAPINNPQKILDVGTGTGIWVMDVADRYPGAEVKGIDISPIQPYWTAPNARFEIDDFNVSWDITSKYDLIHSRELLGSVVSWPTFFSEAFKALKPGGWMDCAEPDLNFRSEIMEFRDDDPHKVWVKLFREVSDKSGMTFEPARELKRWMEEAGFVDVRERVVDVPVGQWPKDEKRRILGMWNQFRLDKGMRDFTERRMRNFMGVSFDPYFLCYRVWEPIPC
ncbi:hypothetical protein ACMFMG_009636 [Clarireedia jacksonii]